MKKLLIASDHAGFDLKEQVKDFFQKKFEVIDFGTHSSSSVDYPDFAHQLCTSLEGMIKDAQISTQKNSQMNSENELSFFGVLICGSGQGMAITANRHPLVRAALCYNPEIAGLSRQHNNANVICLGSRFLDLQMMLALIQIFGSTPFEGGRHQSRLLKISSC